MLTACSGDKYEKELICSTLYSDYTAKIDFVFSDGERNVSGKADVVKSDITSVSFSEPSEYNGISIKSDNTGNADVFSFELSGIPAAVPKSIASDLSLIFSLFSDTIPTKINMLSEDSFMQSSLENVNGNPMVEVAFSENGFEYNLVYDKYSGLPHSISAGNDEISVNVVLSDFVLAEQE